MQLRCFITHAHCAKLGRRGARDALEGLLGRIPAGTCTGSVSASAPAAQAASAWSQAASKAENAPGDAGSHGDGSERSPIIGSQREAGGSRSCARDSQCCSATKSSTSGEERCTAQCRGVTGRGTEVAAPSKRSGRVARAQLVVARDGEAGEVTGLSGPRRGQAQSPRGRGQLPGERRGKAVALAAGWQAAVPPGGKGATIYKTDGAAAADRYVMSAPVSAKAANRDMSRMCASVRGVSPAPAACRGGGMRTFASASAVQPRSVQSAPCADPSERGRGHRE